MSPPRPSATRRPGAAGRRRPGGATGDALRTPPTAARPRPASAAVPEGAEAGATAMRYGALAAPQPVRVATDAAGVPRSVEIDGRRRRVEAVRDDWVVQDLWWTERPVERHYHELVVDPGRVVVLYEDLLTGHWHRH